MRLIENGTFAKQRFMQCNKIGNFLKKTPSFIYLLFAYFSHENSILGQNDEQPISIMAIARDSAAASSVMGNIGRVAKR